jgi:hypothetical protein
LVKSDLEITRKAKADYNRSRYHKDPQFRNKMKESFRKWYAENRKSVIDRVKHNHEKNHAKYLLYQKEHYRYLRYRKKYAAKSG